MMSNRNKNLPDRGFSFHGSKKGKFLIVRSGEFNFFYFSEYFCNFLFLFDVRSDEINYFNCCLR